MAAVRTKLLARGSQSLAASTYVAIYTVPAGETCIVKEVVLTNQGGGASNVYLTSNRAGVRTDVLLWSPSANGQLHVAARWIVLMAGDVLEVVASTAGIRHWHVSGTELEGVAD